MYNLPVYPLRFSSCMSCLGVNAERGFSESGGGNSTCRIKHLYALLAVRVGLAVLVLVEILNRERPAAPGAGLGLCVFHIRIMLIVYSRFPCLRTSCGRCGTARSPQCCFRPSCRAVYCLFRLPSACQYPNHPYPSASDTPLE